MGATWGAIGFWMLFIIGMLYGRPYINAVTDAAMRAVVGY